MELRIREFVKLPYSDQRVYGEGLWVTACCLKRTCLCFLTKLAQTIGAPSENMGML